MKKILLLIILICLFGCTSNVANFEADLSRAIEKEKNIKSFYPDNNKAYYSYYVDPSVGKIYSDQTGNIFLYQNTRFIMNLNVTDIINQKYYNSENANAIQLHENLKMFSLNGEYTDYNNNTYPYQCDVFNLNDAYYLRFTSKYVTFYAQGNYTSIINVAPKMLQISKSIGVDEDKVITHFSSKETIEYKKETIKLFEVIVPINGKIQDILDNKDTISGTTGDDYKNPTPTTLPDGVSDDYQTDDYKTD